MDLEEKTCTSGCFYSAGLSKSKTLPPQKSAAKLAVTSVFSNSCCPCEGHTCSPLWKSCSSLNSCHPSWALGEGNEFFSGSHFISRIIKQFSVQSHSCNTLLLFFFAFFFSNSFLIFMLVLRFPGDNQISFHQTEAVHS